MWVPKGKKAKTSLFGDLSERVVLAERNGEDVTFITAIEALTQWFFHYLESEGGETSYLVATTFIGEIRALVDGKIAIREIFRDEWYGVWWVLVASNGGIKKRSRSRTATFLSRSYRSTAFACDPPQKVLVFQ